MTNNFNFNYEATKHQTCPMCLAVIPLIDPFHDEKDSRSAYQKHIEWHKWLHESYKKP